jgi:DNA-binding response OmpR family regulator
MQALRVGYREQLRERMVRLQALLEACQNDRLHPDAREEMQTLAHKLAGTGLTYGFPDISRLGRALEDALVDHPSEPSSFFIHPVKALLEGIAQATHPDPQAGQPIEAHESREGLPTLLVVDDDVDARAVLGEMMCDVAHIITAGDGAEALRLIEQSPPDLVLLDDSMPGAYSGLELLEKLQTIPACRSIPVIMITANDAPEAVMRGLMAGATDYITKPFDPTSVSHKIHARLRRHDSSILIVDDDETVRELLEYKFQAAGYKVVCAADGAEAWELLLRQPFALAVLDRMMPGYDGMTLLRMMQNTPRLENIPVVFLTARHYGSDVLEGLNTGAADYITKPFNPDEVVTRCIRLTNPKGAR